MVGKPLIYLTYGDVDSSVFRTQVIGFCEFLKNELDIPVQLVSFVPLRLYWKQKKRIESYGIDAKVYPVINRWQGRNWYSKLNAWIVARLDGASVMTRNPVAAILCTALQKKGWNYFYDARGCNYMEMTEFSEASSLEVENMKAREIQSFKKADWVYSVSEELVLHFKEVSLYRDHNHSVVPCCYIPNESIGRTKMELFGSEDVTVFCYAGALSVWNFPKSFLELCSEVLKHPNYRLIILSNQIEVLDKYPFMKNDRTILKSVAHHEVGAYLAASDYGILLRKKAVTNRVASPSKFADYLAAGCKVVISSELGDFSEFVSNHSGGIQYEGRKDNKKLAGLEPLSETEQKRIEELASLYFLRKSSINLVKYRNLLNIHNGR